MKSIKSAFTSFAFKVPDELMDQVKLAAGRDYRDVNDVVVELLLEYVRRGRDPYRDIYGPFFTPSFGPVMSESGKGIVTVSNGSGHLHESPT